VTRLPDDVFISTGRELDGKQISLADNLDAKGREILKHLERRGKSITSWEIALAERYSITTAMSHSLVSGHSSPKPRGASFKTTPQPPGNRHRQ
jgi:hypothetical protein